MAKPSKPNPQILREEVLKHLEAEAFPIFHCEHDMWPSERSIWWDSDRYPSYKQFTQVARAAGAKMMLFFDMELSEQAVMDAEDSLEIAGVEPDEFREYSRRIADMRSYAGFICRLGLGFQLDGLFYWYEVEAPWYKDFLDLLEELNLSGFPYGDGPDGEDDEEDPPMGNYFSNN